MNPNPKPAVSAEEASDRLLRWGRMAAGRSKANQLPDDELRAIAWFAALPLVKDKKGLEEQFFDERNLLSGAFFSAWLHKPDVTFKILTKVRKLMADPSRWPATVTESSETGNG